LATIFFHETSPKFSFGLSTLVIDTKDNENKIPRKEKAHSI